MFRPLRQHRYDVLRKQGFAKSEARTLSKLAFKLPYIKHIRENRTQQINTAIDWAKQRRLKRADAVAHLKDIIKDYYKEQGYQDIWAMIRAERAKSLARGEYTPRKPKKYRGKIYKGDVQAQRKRYQARKESEKQGRTGVQFDTQGKVIGWVEYNPETGLFEVRNA